MTIIETSRCRAIPVSESDRKDVARLYASPEVRAYLGGTVDAPIFNLRFDKLLTRPEGYAWAVRLKNTKDFFGLVQLDRHHDGEAMEVSYQFTPEARGKGYATEVVGAVVEYSLKELGLPNVVAETQLANERSKRLLERIGMKQIRTLIRYDAPQVIYEARL